MSPAGIALADPSREVHLLKNLFAQHGRDAKAVPAAAALRVLRSLGSTANPGRLAPYLVQLLSHPNPDVRSKAVLLLGRANLNLARVRAFLQSYDSRVRANAIETLWGQNALDVCALLREAAKDPNRRVALNALLGLCKSGDRAARLDLERLAGSPDPMMRSGSAWAMGETGDPEFAPVLNLLAQDRDPKVRAMAEKSRAKLFDSSGPGAIHER